MVEERDALEKTPVGWYVLAESRELQPGELKICRFAGRDLVVFRTASGKTAITDPYCPHLGAHLGHGGSVRGETLRCPFHGFSFDTQGVCVSTEYGTKPPPKAILRAWPVQEVNGLILVFYHPHQEAPSWKIPALDGSQWSPVRLHRWSLSSHPQETTENSVDIGHFSVVHGYEEVKILSDLQTDGPYLTAQYGMLRRADFLGKAKKVRASFKIHVHGLGYSLVESEVPEYGIQFRHFVLASPSEPGKIDLRVGLSGRFLESPAKLHPLLALIPSDWSLRLLTHFSFASYKEDVSQDFHIWEHKRYIEPPILAKGDGPIGKYRQWAKQFYPEDSASKGHFLEAAPALNHEMQAT